MAQQILRDILAHAAEAGGPAEHAELVVITVADDVGARVDQHLDGLKVRGFDGEVKGVGVVAKIADPDVGATLQQQPHAGPLSVSRLRVAATVPGRLVQRRLLLMISPARIDQVGMGVEQASELVGAAVLRSVEDGVDRPLHLRRARRALLEFAGEQLDRFVPRLLGDLVHAAAVIVGRAGIEAGLEGAADRLDIAGAGGVEDRFAVRFRRRHPVDMRLELPPAGEAIVARDGELRDGELGLRVLLAQHLEALLGLVLEMLEAWPRGQRLGWTRGRTRVLSHEIPSFHMRPVSALSGRKSGYDRLATFGGLSPLRGPSATAAATEIIPKLPAAAQASLRYLGFVAAKCFPRNPSTRVIASAQACALPPVVAPRPVGEFWFRRSATKRTGARLSKEWCAPG